ncbi:MAG: ABC transporter ATP-binding protein/permease [Myxococcales bacterium]|nr:ABC transporter ATP-binding protein/permease [Myxococcales bacterium]
MTSPLRRLLPVLWPEFASLAAGCTGLGIAAILALVGPWLVAQAIDVDLPAGDVAALQWRAVAYLAAVFGTGICTWLAKIALEMAAQRALVRLEVQAFEHMASHDLAVHDELRSGSLVGRIQGDISVLRVLLVEVVFALPAEALQVAGMVGVLWWSAPSLVAPVIVVLIVYLVILGVFRRVAAPIFLAHRKAASRLTGILAETVHAMPALRALRRHHWGEARAADHVQQVQRLEAWSRFQPVWFFNVARLARSVSIVAVLALGAAQVAQGSATVGALVLALAYLRQMFTPLMRLSDQLATLERARAAAVRVDELLSESRRIVDPPRPTPWPGLRQGIHFHDVSFSYRHGTPVLRGIQLHVPAGTRLGLVGATGAGKSTILDLLLRFRDPTEGQVTIDGVDLRDLAVADLRAHGALVLQEVQLLPGSVHDNVGGSRAQAAQALEMLDLALDLDQSIRATSLSLGERQLLTFARAWVADPELLVLDEATSAVDPESEARVQHALDTLMAGRTAVIVAHRLDTVRSCDRIAVLHEGRVAELGSHDELLALGGRYAHLVRTQEAA